MSLHIKTPCKYHTCCITTTLVVLLNHEKNTILRSSMYQVQTGQAQILVCQKKAKKRQLHMYVTFFLPWNKMQESCSNDLTHSD